MPERLIVIGNGMAAGRMLEELLAVAPDRYEIRLFGAEPRVNYNRIMLSPVLSGETVYEDILIHDRDWYARNGIDLRSGCRITEINREAREVVTEHGERFGYDRLVIATGSVPVMIPVPGRDLLGVCAYRDLDDVRIMQEAARFGGRAVVIGGGLLGLEAAAGLAMQGMKVSVVHLMPTLMERQLDPAAAKLLQRAVESRNIDILCGANTKAILGTDRVEGLELDDGRVLPCDLVVMAVGIRPNVALAKAAGLDVGRGIKVDDGLQTNDPSIFALGECAEHRGTCYGLVAPLYDMAKVLAARLADQGEANYEGSSLATKLKVTGINLYSAGDFAEADGREEIVLHDDQGGTYRRLILKEDRLIGAVLYGDTSDGPWFFDLIRGGEALGGLRDALMFGEAYAPDAPAPAAERPNTAPASQPRFDREMLDREHREELEAA